MANETAQTYKNHTRLDPLYHFFLVPVTLFAVIGTIWRVAVHPSWRSGFQVVLAIAATVAVYKIRTYALKAQDRVIRLEEHLRLAQLLPEPLRSRIGELTVGQLIALRFGSDAEIPGLVQKTLSANLKPADIKKAIVNWRPDYHRL